MVPALEGFKIHGKGGGQTQGEIFCSAPWSEESCENSLPLVREGFTEEVIFDLGPSGEEGLSR